VISANLVGASAALDRLRAMGDAASSGVARAIAKLGIDLQNNVQQNKLSGQVLQVRSGSLRQSISVQVNQSDTAISATVYSDLDYAAAQEYGFTGVVNVRASLRQIKEAFGHPITAESIGVGAYSRRMDLPQRSFLRSALDDMAPDVDAGVKDALREALS
jgi:Bacteriophage HK97-gp10, putative tail-component